MRTISVTATASINSGMKENMKEVGSKVSNMGKGFTKKEIAPTDKVYGKTGKELGGSIKNEKNINQYRRFT